MGIKDKKSPCSITTRALMNRLETCLPYDYVKNRGNYRKPHRPGKVITHNVRAIPEPVLEQKREHVALVDSL